MVRRPRDRPARQGAQQRLLWALARRYAWWLSPREALARPHFIATQVMEMVDYEDVLRLEAALGR